MDLCWIINNTLHSLTLSLSLLYTSIYQSCLTGLLQIMAQIGCFVPATSARMTVCDAVLTRMGASDNLLMGSSTFYEECMETSLILRRASSRSLVILDELGRGTSKYTIDRMIAKIGVKSSWLCWFCFFVFDSPPTLDPFYGRFSIFYIELGCNFYI